MHLEQVRMTAAAHLHAHGKARSTTSHQNKSGRHGRCNCMQTAETNPHKLMCAAHACKHSAHHGKLPGELGADASGTKPMRTLAIKPR